MRRNLLIGAGIAIAGVAALAALWLFLIGPAHENARIAAGFVAKSLCSCMFVDGRAEDACRADLAGKFSSVQAKVDEQAKTVRTRLWFFAHATAESDPLYGCRLD